jgi:hypothetical protein
MKQYQHLLLDKAAPINDSKLSSLKNKIFSAAVVLPMVGYQEFCNTMHHWLTHNTANTITGLDGFAQEVCVGVTDFINNLVMQHGIDNIQIFEHDYTYYRRLLPNKVWATVGDLIPNKPLLIAMPFPGNGDVHWNMQQILNEALEKNIPVHIDGAWISSAKDIVFDFGHPAIKSVAFSLSKGLALDWNRIGVRYSRCVDDTDSITIANRFNTINSIDLSVGMLFMQQFAQSYLWDKYGTLYNDACKAFLLKPTKCIHMATHFNTGKPHSFRDVFDAVENSNGSMV